MKYQNEYAGKWVVVHDDIIVAADKSLKLLREKMQSRKDAAELKYSLVPKGFMAG